MTEQLEWFNGFGDAKLSTEAAVKIISHCDEMLRLLHLEKHTYVPDSQSRCHKIYEIFRSRIYYGLTDDWVSAEEYLQLRLEGLTIHLAVSLANAWLKKHGSIYTLRKEGREVYAEWRKPQSTAISTVCIDPPF